MKQRILIISDERTGESLRRVLDEMGFEVTLTENAEDGYRQLVGARFHLALVSLDSAITGAGLIKRIRATPKLSQLRVMTIAEWGTGQATIALAQGADAFEPKPIEADRLAEAVENLLRPDMVMTARASATNGDLEES
jgi:DNA-binding response OmpR family regulator